MNTVDIFIIVIVGLSCLMGIIRGLTKELLSLISWVGAGVAAYVLLPVARHYAAAYIKNPMIADAVAGLVIFLVFLIFFSLISHVISSYVKHSALGGVDRSLGLGFGIFRAVLLICAMELSLSSFMPRHQYPDVFQTARFTALIQAGSERLLNILPENIQNFVMQQQAKFLHDHAKREIDQKIDDVIAGAIEGALTDAVKGAVDNGSMGSTMAGAHTQSHIIQGDHVNGFVEPKTVQPKAPMDTKKAAHDLATLQAHGTAKEKTGYNHEQREDLNRLLGTLG